MLESIFTETTQSSVSLGSCLICMFVAIILGVVISFTHKMNKDNTKLFINTYYFTSASASCYLFS